MERNIPRAAIHVDIDKNNHYNYSRKRLNFEIVKGGKIVPLGSQSVPLHERLQHRLDELGFKPYMDAKRPDQVSRNSPNCTVGIIFSGDHDVLNRLAFGEQKLNTSDPNADHSKVVLQKGIYDWALDTYRFACEKWGEENVIGFDVLCDETSIHVHVQTVFCVLSAFSSDCLQRFDAITITSQLFFAQFRLRISQFLQQRNSVMRQGSGKWYRIANRSPQNMRLDMQMLYECYHFIETLMLCCLLKLTFLNFLVELAFWKQC